MESSYSKEILKIRSQCRLLDKIENDIKKLRDTADICNNRKIIAEYEYAFNEQFGVLEDLIKSMHVKLNEIDSCKTL